MAAYLLAICDITNMNEDMKEYAVFSAQLVNDYYGKYLIRGPSAEDIQGEKLEGSYVVLTEFQTMENLKAFWLGDAYQEIKHLRDGTGTYHISIYESPPPDKE